MTPDPERENALRERVQALLATAPEPDTARLDAALQSARRTTRRRQRRRQALAWLAAALLGTGAATAGWWLGGSDRWTDQPVEERSEPPPRSQQPRGNNERGPNDAERNGSGGRDSGLIYQGVE